jgi:uncharacterized protein (TIGR03792 family)
LLGRASLDGALLGVATVGWIVVSSMGLLNDAPVKETRTTDYGFVSERTFGTIVVIWLLTAVGGVSGGRIGRMSESAASTTTAITPGMVIEELHFTLEPSDVEQFLDVEGRVWTGFLKTCDGFLRKETWLPEDEPGKVVVMIWWNTMAQWKSITSEQCDEVDAQMGEWLRPISYFKAHHIARVSEGS